MKNGLFLPRSSYKTSNKKTEKVKNNDKCY